MQGALRVVGFGLLLAAGGCPPAPLPPPTPVWYPPPREDLLPPSIAPRGEEDALLEKLPAGVSRLARVEGVAMGLRRSGDALVFGVAVTHVRVVVREGGGLLREVPNLEGGRMGDDVLTGAVDAAPDGSRLFLPVRRADGTSAVLGWDQKAPPVVLADGIWPARLPDGSLLAQVVGAAGRGRALKRFVEGRNPLDPREDPVPVLSPRDGRTIAWPVPSPDGKTIAYLDAPGGLPGADAPAAIATMSIDGGSPRTIVLAAMRAGPPAWSPDGRWILFSARPERATSRDLYAVRATGGAPVRLSEDEGDEDFPWAWQDPAGDTLLWVARGHRAIAVEMKEITGEGVVQVPSLPAYAIAPAVSADGSTIAFVVPTGPDAGVWSRLTKGAQARRIFAGATAPVRPVFAGTEGTRRIVYAAPTDAGIDLFAVGDTGTAVRITSDGLVYTDAPPAASADGSEVAWVTDLERSRTLVTAPIEGGERRVVAKDVRAFAWATDGSFVVVRDVEGRTVLSVLSGETVADLRAVASPAWRPVRLADDGAVFVVDRSDRPRLLRVERESGEVTTALELVGSADPWRSDASVDPAGRWAMSFAARTSSEIRSRPWPRERLPAD